VTLLSLAVVVGVVVVVLVVEVVTCNVQITSLGRDMQCYERLLVN